MKERRRTLVHLNTPHHQPNTPVPLPTPRRQPRQTPHSAQHTHAPIQHLRIRMVLCRERRSSRQNAPMQRDFVGHAARSSLVFFGERGEGVGISVCGAGGRRCVGGGHGGILVGCVGGHGVCEGWCLGGDFLARWYTIVYCQCEVVGEVAGVCRGVG